LLDGVRTGVYWLLDFGKGPLDYFRWKKIRSVVDLVDVFIAVSNATRDVVGSHLPELGTGSRWFTTPRRIGPGATSLFCRRGGTTTSSTHIVLTKVKQGRLRRSSRLHSLGRIRSSNQPQTFSQLRVHMPQWTVARG
jgi:hypothetical protein